MNALKDILKTFYYIAKSLAYGVQLREIQNNTANISKGDILLFSVLRDEAYRIPWFLEYYRKLGVSHFFFIDNGSTDNFLNIVSTEPDVSVWYTEHSYKKANFGLHWSNALMRKYASGHWSIVVDPDEFLVFPYMDRRPLKELTWHLESENRRSFFCLMLDMYGNLCIDQAVCKPGQDPLTVCPYFDSHGYTQKHNHVLLNTWIQGGVRSRIFFPDSPAAAPALNKTPLVLWRWTYSYVSSTHAVLPSFLNIPHARDHASPTGVLLHFKFLSQFRNKLEKEMHRSQHFGDSREYKAYLSKMDAHTDASMTYQGSIRYKDWAQLENLGLMGRGHWF